MQKFLFLFLTLPLLFCAAEIDINGDFEKCTASSTGIILPEGWIINKVASKKAEVYITREPDSVRNGFFALQVEVEEGGSMYLMKYQTRIEARPGDQVELSVWGTGSGKLALGFIQNGVRDGQGGIFLGTIIQQGKEFAPEEDWSQQRFAYTIKEQKKNEFLYEQFTVNPVIYVNDKADMLLDDLKLSITRAERKSEK